MKCVEYVLTSAECITVIVNVKYRLLGIVYRIINNIKERLKTN